MRRSLLNLALRAGALAVVAVAAALAPDPVALEVVPIVKDVPITWTGPAATSPKAEGITYREGGQLAEVRVALPPAPTDAASMRGVLLRLTATPTTTVHNGKRVPGDPWTRLGRVMLQTGRNEAPVELMRFITAFGGRTEHTVDVTPFLPLLSGERTFAIFIRTYSNPAWTVSADLEYGTDDLGARRPGFAKGVISGVLSPAAASLSALIEIPRGVLQPRVRILSTGHGNPDGDEFHTRTHVLKVDGREIARFRPWMEVGGKHRKHNTWAARKMVEGRELIASDFDRSGWSPGATVEPYIVPAPELTPGRHEVELTILDFPKDEIDRHWWASVAVVADGEWSSPAEPPPGPPGPNGPPDPAGTAPGTSGTGIRSPQSRPAQP